jgi:riboflavin kinase/FMN adenylyltransferase
VQLFFLRGLLNKSNFFFGKIFRKNLCSFVFFDGVHLGHQAVIQKTVEKATATNYIPTVFTFSQNPKSIIQKGSIKDITTLDEKKKLFHDLGVNLLYCVDFTQIMELNSSEFVEKFLAETLQARCAFCGFNFRFGKNAAASSDDLMKICKDFGIEVYVIPQVRAAGLTVSSSQIRNLMAFEDYEKVSALLGRKFVG